jgi:predicted metalloprotease with PDZ domain
MTPERYLDNLSGLLQTYLETPGRFVQSAAEASFDAWIKHYRQDANSPNSSISYYLKGGLIALVLDLEIRGHRRNRSLDDLMRFLYREYYRKRRRGFTEAEFRRACNDIGGKSLGEMIDRYAYGTEEIDFSKYLDYAGLRLADLREDKPAAPKSYLGMNVKNADGRVVIAAVPSGTPAYEHGLNVNDEVLGLDGFRVSLETIGVQLDAKPPGTRIEVLVSRAGKLRLIPVVLGEKKTAEWQIVKAKDVGKEKRRLYESWLRAPWDEAPAPSS